MKELHLQGWLCHDDNGLIALKASQKDSKYAAHSIQSDIFDFASNSDYYDSPSLGGQRATIPSASIRIYATNKECSLDEATGTLISHLYGCADSDIGYEGYSEYTITGYYNKTFTVGGHNLAAELERYLGKYVHFVLECADDDAVATAETKEDDTKYIYTVVVAWCNDSSSATFEVLGTFDTLDAAKNCFADERNKEMQSISESGWEIYDDSELYFDAGEDGYYNENHFTIKISKTKLQ